MWKWLLLVTGILSIGFAPHVPKRWSIFLGIYGALTSVLCGGGLFMDKMIKIRQSYIVADKNAGMEINGVPKEGVQLPPVDIAQSRISSRENTGLSFNYSPNSGSVQLNHTRVEGDEGMAIINPDAGTVVINPSAGSVHFLHRK